MDILVMLGGSEVYGGGAVLGFMWTRNPDFTLSCGLWFSQDSKASLLASLSAKRAVTPCLMS